MAELSIVLPVFNERESIALVIDAWTSAMTQLGIDYCVLVYDDGSTDGTDRTLAGLVESQSRLFMRRHSNRGHGPTILRGYREAQSPWVFQVDSDNEMAPDAFRDLWARREKFDLLLGVREGRQLSWSRRALTRFARLIVSYMFRSTIHDVNVPYRLMRRSAIQTLLKHIPEGTFAPNLVISGLSTYYGLRVYETPVACVGRQFGRGSGGPRWWLSVAQALVQTFRIQRTARDARHA